MNVCTHILSVTAVSLVLTSAACQGDSSSSTPSNSAPSTAAVTSEVTTVSVAAGEFYFHLDRRSAPAGKVTFVANNEGKVGHEMVVIKTDTKAGDLPYENGEASEEGAVGEIGEDDLEVGETSKLTLELQPGHYALICNLPGHFKGGMYTDFVVT